MIEKGSKVKINYRLQVDGETLEDSFEEKPLEYVQGEGQLIPGLEEELEGSEKGTVLEVSVPPEKAYGQRDPEAVHEVAKDAFSSVEGVEVGGFVEGRTRNGEVFRARVVEENKGSFMLDMNHPLAGKTLDFKVEVVEVESE